MKALLIERNPTRFAAAAITGRTRPGSGTSAGIIELTDMDEPVLPNDEWVRLSPRMAGICGSDLATIDGRSSRWFEPIVSFPFVPGHEVVADTEDGRRVVVEPVLGCLTRGVDPPCAPCSRGDQGNCERLDQGCIEPGLQTGFCCDTGGGWSTSMVAHASQVHEVPDEVSDRAAVMVEPTACAVHAVLRADVGADESVAVIGAGTLGQLTLAALDHYSPPARLFVAAKHDHQHSLAKEFSTHSGTLAVVDPVELPRRIRSASRTTIIEPLHTDTTGWSVHSRLGGGVDVTIDCVGTSQSIATALAVTRPRGRVVLVGMPGVETLDLTPLWQREITIIGAYTYGTETIDGSTTRTFDLAMDLVARRDLGRLVSATYPLDRFRDAIAHAGSAGRRGAVKIAFSMTDPDNPQAPVLKPRKARRR